MFEDSLKGLKRRWASTQITHLSCMVCNDGKLIKNYIFVLFHQQREWSKMTGNHCYTQALCTIVRNDKNYTDRAMAQLSATKLDYGWNAVRAIVRKDVKLLITTGYENVHNVVRLSKLRNRRIAWNKVKLVLPRKIAHVWNDDTTLSQNNRAHVCNDENLPFKRPSAIVQEDGNLPYSELSRDGPERRQTS